MTTLIIWVLVLRFPSTYETFPGAFETEAVCQHIGRAAVAAGPGHPQFECRKSVLYAKGDRT